MKEQSYSHFSISDTDYYNLRQEIITLKGAIEHYRNCAKDSERILEVLLQSSDISSCAVEFSSLTSAADTVCDRCENILSSIEIK